VNAVMNFEFNKMRGVFFTSEVLLASQEGLCYVYLKCVVMI
jgi:hypothetical protein